MEKKISPSLMCCDFFEMGKQLSAFEKEKIEYLHVDVMDGVFVPNYTLGTDFIKQVKKNCSIPVDIHLMIENPEEKLDWFCFGEGDIVSIHYESTNNLNVALKKIKDRGAKAFVAIKPATDFSVLSDVLDLIDGVLVMTVNPGFAGQKLVEGSIEKIRKTRRFLDEKNYQNIEIEVDGNVSFANARLMSDAGANIFVAGTSSVFCGNLSEGIATLREAIK